MTLRRLAPLATAVAPLVLLAGCGGSTSEGASATLANIEGSSYVTLPPATTTTTTTVADTEEGGTSDTEQTYEVRAGDSVSGIAARHGISAEILAEYNQWPDGIFHSIFPGDIVRIPPDSQIPVDTPAASGDDGSGDVATDAGDDAAADDAEEESDGEGCTYELVAGDNPSKVADRFGITVDELIAANDASVMSTFLVGSEIVIPPGGDC